MVKFDTYANEYTRLLDASVAASGEDAAYFADYKARYLAERVAIRPNSKILDFGCGVGNVVAALARRLPGALIHGFDPSEKSLEQIDRKLKEQGRFTTDPDALDRDYDVVQIANVLHHVRPERRIEFLAQAVERLAPSGRLAVFEHNPANPFTRHVVDNCPLDKDAALLPAAETMALLTAVGLISVRRVYIVFFPRALRMARLLESRLGWCPLGAQYVVVGEKKRRNSSAV